MGFADVKNNFSRVTAEANKTGRTDTIMSHYKEVAVKGRKCCLSHYPTLDWNKGAVHHGIRPEDASFMLHGHIHSCTKATNGDNARTCI